MSPSSTCSCFDWGALFSPFQKKNSKGNNDDVLLTKEAQSTDDNTPQHDDEPIAQEEVLPSQEQQDPLDKIVDEMMSSDGINQAWIPDYVERRLYKNILKTVHAHIQQLAHSARIEVAGMSLTFVVQPSPVVASH